MALYVHPPIQRAARTRRLLVAGFCAAGLALGVSAGPAAAQYQPILSQTVSNPTPSAGQELVVSGTGCDAGSTVSTALDGTTLATSTADGDGSFSTDVTVGTGTTSGSHELTSTCGTAVLSSSIDVVDAGADQPAGDQPSAGGSSGERPSVGSGPVAGTLARTGAGTGRLVQIGVVTAALGGAALALSRTRRLRAS